MIISNQLYSLQFTGPQQHTQAIYLFPFTVIYIYLCRVTGHHPVQKNANFGVLWDMNLMMKFHVYCDMMPELWNSGVRKALSRLPLLGNGLVKVFLRQ
jgi:hypothetical protein